VGSAVVRRLAEAGWRVTGASRGQKEVPESEGEVELVRLDRADTGALRAALGSGVDVLVDVISMTPEDAEQLVQLGDVAGSVIAFSSASVYADARTGRKLLADPWAAEWPNPIPESQPTVAPGGDDYSARKAAVERILLERHPSPATILRPGAIYGPRDTWSREWHFVKRALDGRRLVVLPDRGRSCFHPVASANVAELVRLAAEKPGRRVLNAGDEPPRTVLEIAKGVAEAMGHDWALLLVPEPITPETAVAHPWAAPKPFVLEVARAREELGYADLVSYPEAIAATCRWLRTATAGRDWREVLPVAARLYGGLFDYEAEDAAARRWTAA
jgi:nucleoside-diphosphate-sugar epimerase